MKKTQSNLSLGGYTNSRLLSAHYQLDDSFECSLAGGDIAIQYKRSWYERHKSRLLMRKDAGILKLLKDKLIFQMDQGDEILVGETAQLPDHSDPSVTSLLEHRVTIMWTEVPEADNSPRVMAHKIIRHQDIAELAFEISRSPEGGSAVDNWLRSENDLIGFSQI